MSVKLPTIKQMLDQGAHFGHLRARSHPRAHQYTFEVRDRIMVIDLDKTLQQLEMAAKWCKDAAEEGKTILFVGTKKQVQDLVQVAAQKAQMPYVSNRWLAGTLTNFDEITRNIRKLERLEKDLVSDTGSATKREKVKMQAAIEKMHKVLDGIVGMTKLPDVLFVVDAAHEKIAIEEADRLGIPVVAITDTNVNPDIVTMPIPANDDSRLAVQGILNVITNAISEGRAKIKPVSNEQKAK